MTLTVIVLVALSIVLDVIGQLCFKLGLDRLPAPTTIQLYDYPTSYLFRRQSLKLHGLIAR